MKKQIRVQFLKSFVQDSVVFTMDILEKKFDVIIDAINPQYIFAMESVYWNKENFLELLTSNENAVRLFTCGEAIAPDLNLFDYAFSFDDSLSSKGRVLKIPYYESQIGYTLNDVSELNDSKLNISPEDILKGKTKFCNFIYSNAKAHPNRDKLFYKISEYKKVDSLGRHLNNVKIDDTRNSNDWQHISVNLKSKYKFSIAAESASFDGYVSEKIMTSMMANTIPIYWGTPEVKNQYNTKSFINCHDYNNFDEVVARIKEIDENDDLYCEIMSQPWRTQEQLERHDVETRKFYKDFYNIFEQDIEKVRKRPLGCWPDIYKDFLISLTAAPLPSKKVNKISREIKRIGNQIKNILTTS